MKNSLNITERKIIELHLNDMKKFIHAQHLLPKKDRDATALKKAIKVRDTMAKWLNE